MLNLSYNQLIHELSYGRELEFTFDDVKYAISVKSSKERYFTVFNPQLTISFCSLDDLLNQVAISGQTIEQVWPNVTDFTLF